MWCLVTSRGRRLAIDALPAVLGSDAAADIVLSHDSIAPRHARLTAGSEGGLTIASLAGALVEVAGWRVEVGDLSHGDELMLGLLSFRLVDDRAGPLPDELPAATRPPAAEQAELQLRRRGAATQGGAGAAAESGHSGLAAAGDGTVAGPTGATRAQGLGAGASASGSSTRGRRRVAPLRTHLADGRRGLLHADLSQLGAGQKALILTALLALCAALAWGLASAVSLIV